MTSESKEDIAKSYLLSKFMEADLDADDTSLDVFDLFTITIKNRKGYDVFVPSRNKTVHVGPTKIIRFCPTQNLKNILNAQSNT